MKLAICVGAAKAGTSSLHSLLSQHPEIVTSVPKETDFFINNDLCQKGSEYYLNNYFDRSGEEKLAFEADPIYMYARHGIENIHRLFPEAYIIVMLRQPVERAFSQYIYRAAYARYDESFEQMCTHEKARISLSDAHRLEYGCLDRSLYGPQIAEILKYFPLERVYFLLFEEFVKDQNAETNKLLKWLGLTPTDFSSVQDNPSGDAKSVTFAKLLFHPKHRSVRRLASFFIPRKLRSRLYNWMTIVNLKPYTPENKPKLDKATLKSLTASFVSDIEAVQTMTGLDLRRWID